MSEISRLLSNRVKVTGPLSVSPGRYAYLSLEEAEPNLGAPPGPPPSGQVYVLTSDENGIRAWTLIEEGGQGIQGVQGPQGIQGLQGIGNQGVQGIQGDGVQGLQGIQGDGAQGIQGVDGSSVQIVGSVPDVNVIGDPQATLNDPGNSWVPPSAGDGVLDDATGDLWVYDGALWVNVGPVRGPQGIQGIQGLSIQGIQGSGGQGIQGLQGNDGAQGETGSQGIQGEFGIQGDFGPQGIQGDLGPQGTQGIQGDQGTQGVQGESGTQGIQGTRGFQGVQGTDGEQGVQGDLGFQGTQGISNQGVQGETGTQGQQGVQGGGGQGIQGDQGIQGISIQGDQGTQGILGEQGVQGIQGDLGPQGAQGIQGVLGEQGIQGIQGDLGPQGAQGIQGELGIQGSTGAQGTRGSQGFQGVQGDFGIQGEQGETGIQGPTGLQGNRGNTGLQGIQGDQGVQGIQGIQGDQGIQGIQGSRGRDFIIIGSNDDVIANTISEGFSSGPNPSDAEISAYLNSYFDGDPGPAAGFNDGIIDEATGDIYVLQFDGVTWVNVGNLRGLQGTQGTQGLQGDQGTQGIQGDQGTQGLQGFQGDKAGYPYEWSASTIIADPGAGAIRFNGISGSPAATTTIAISSLTSVNLNISDFIANWNTYGYTGNRGTLNFVQYSNSGTTSNQFTVTNVTDNGSWLEVDVINGTGQSFAANDDIVLQFFPTGAQGIQGVQGDQGTQGIQGDQGIQGIQGLSIQGVQGIQGTLGIQGDQGIQGIQGDQGIQGIQGDQGIQGIQGDQGTQGIQGLSIQGIQGDQGTQGIQGEEGTSLVIVGSVTDAESEAIAGGFSSGPTASDEEISNYLLSVFDGDPEPQIQQNQGIIDEATGNLWVYNGTEFNNVGAIKGNQGIQGIQGDQGVQGNTGIQGPTGNFGGATFNYTFSSTTTAGDPGAGLLRLNNATQNSATELYIDQQDDDSAFIDNFLVTIDSSTSLIKGHVKISENGDPSRFNFYAINSLTNNIGWWTISVSFVSGSGATFLNTDDILVTFARTGDIGNQGNQGIQGDQGTQGIFGEQGIQGIQGQFGPQGIQGIQGDTGTQGSQGVQGELGKALEIIANVTDAQAQGTTQTDINNEINADLAGQGITAEEGDAVIDNATGDLYILRGGDWQNSGNLRGQQGLQGIQGTLGIQGDQGIQGIQGTLGIQGDTGTQGIQGDQGTQGIQGDFGPQGTQGIQGDQGIQGSQGATGGTGSTGVQGLQGTDGPTGDTGVQGTTGPAASTPDEIDNIILTSAFDGATTVFEVRKSSAPGTPLTMDDIEIEVSRLMISVGGIIQQPDDSGVGVGGTVGFRLNSNTGTSTLEIIFAEAPESGQSFFGVIFQKVSTSTTPYATKEESLVNAIIFGV